MIHLVLSRAFEFSPTVFHRANHRVKELVAKQNRLLVLDSLSRRAGLVREAAYRVAFGKDARTEARALDSDLT